MDSQCVRQEPEHDDTRIPASSFLGKRDRHKETGREERGGGPTPRGNYIAAKLLQTVGNGHPLSESPLAPHLRSPPQSLQ
jgi:hypothetical protein